MALEELKKDTNTENGDKPLSDPKKVVQKITELVASHSTGLFVTNVPEQFRYFFTFIC